MKPLTILFLSFAFAPFILFGQDYFFSKVVDDTPYVFISSKDDHSALKTHILISHFTNQYRELDKVIVDFSAPKRIDGLMYYGQRTEADMYDSGFVFWPVKTKNNLFTTKLRLFATDDIFIQPISNDGRLPRFNVKIKEILFSLSGYRPTLVVQGETLEHDSAWVQFKTDSLWQKLRRDLAKVHFVSSLTGRQKKKEAPILSPMIPPIVDAKCDSFENAEYLKTDDYWRNDGIRRTVLPFRFNRSRIDTILYAAVFSRRCNENRCGTLVIFSPDGKVVFSEESRGLNYLVGITDVDDVWGHEIIVAKGGVFSAFLEVILFAYDSKSKIFSIGSRSEKKIGYFD